jgi:hypothetical protein
MIYGGSRLAAPVMVQSTFETKFASTAVWLAARSFQTQLAIFFVSKPNTDTTLIRW